MPIIQRLICFHTSMTDQAVNKYSYELRRLHKKWTFNIIMPINQGGSKIKSERYYDSPEAAAIKAKLWIKSLKVHHKIEPISDDGVKRQMNTP